MLAQNTQVRLQKVKTENDVLYIINTLSKLGILFLTISKYLHTILYKVPIKYFTNKAECGYLYWYPKFL